MKQVTTLFVISLIAGSFLFSGCMGHITPLELPSVKFEVTETPTDDILLKISEMKIDIGESPIPKVLVQNGITYYAFTQEQLHQLTAKNELTKYLEETVKLQHERVKVLIMEINQLKRLTELQRMETESFQRLYINAKNEAINLRNENVLNGIVYKVIVIGQLIAIILLI